MLPVRNGAPWLDECLASLRAQSQPADELLVIDDGSVDGSQDVVSRWADRRTRVLTGPQKGLFAALALGVNEASHDLIARMDQDDIAHPERLARQVALMTADTSLVACGTWSRLVSGRPLASTFRPPTDTAGVRRFMGLGNPLVHSSVMFFRHSVQAVGNYRAPDARPYPEDYDLWLRLAREGAIVNIPRYLMRYRRHASGLASTGQGTIRPAAARLACDRAAELLAPSGLRPHDAAIVRAYHRSPEPGDRFTPTDVRSLLGRLARAGDGPTSARLFPVSTHIRLTSAALRREVARNA